MIALIPSSPILDWRDANGKSARSDAGGFFKMEYLKMIWILPLRRWNPAMSRSRRKPPILAVTTCRSEREEKTLWHQRWRARERIVLESASPDTLSAHLPLVENDVVDVWSMGKDGHTYRSARDQADMADRIANQKGRTQKERASLKMRVLRKWMGK